MNRSPSLSPVFRARLVRLHLWILIVGAMSLGQACATSERFVRGTVTVVDPTRIEIKHKTGQLVSIALSSGTTYRWDDNPASLHDVFVGGRVLVVLDQPEGPSHAAVVRIFGRPVAKGSTRRSARETR